MDCIRCGASFDSLKGSCPKCAWDPNDTLDQMAGYRAGETVNGRYEISESLGVGCLGTVLKAVDRDVGIGVAFKVIHPALTPDTKTRNHFLDAMHTVVRIKHHSMARLFDIDQDEDERCYVVRQLLEGVPLRRLMENRRSNGRAFSLEEVLPIVEQVVDFLEYGGGVVHGSLTPEKIWILPQHLKVTDAGIAEHLPPAAVWHRIRKGGRSRGYAAPELSWGRPPDTRTDIFSLGALVGEMLTQVAFDGRPDVFSESDPDLPQEIDGVLRHAVQEDPNMRFDTLSSFLTALSDPKAHVYSVPSVTTEDTYVDRAPLVEQSEGTKKMRPSAVTLDDSEVVFDDTAQVSMEDVIRAHVEGQSTESTRESAPSPEKSVEQEPSMPPNRPTELGALAQAAKRGVKTPPPRADAPVRRTKPHQVTKPPPAALPSETTPLPERPVEPVRPSRPSRDTRPPSYVSPPVAQKADDPTAAAQEATPRGAPAKRSPVAPASAPRGNGTLEIQMSELEMVEERQERREVTQEIDLEMIEEVNDNRPNDPSVIAAKLERQAEDAERDSANELLRRSRRLEGVDPRLVRAAHSLESDRRGARSRQAAQLLRNRAENLDGIDPRLLRAAARLEEAKIGGEPEAEEKKEEPEKPVQTGEEEWREDIERTASDSVISFLSPPVVEQPADVRGFPKNQSRRAQSRTAPPPRSPASRPSRPPPPRRR